MDPKVFLELLKRKSGFEAVNHDYKPGYLRVMGRVHPNFMGQWKIIIHTLLTEEANASWKIDISKNYFLRGGKIFYGWRLIAQGDGVEAIQKIIQGAPNPVTADIIEVPLVGASPNRYGDKVSASNGGPPAALLRRR